MKKRLLKVLSILLLSLLCLIFLIEFLDLIHFKCVFRELFGIYCAGCGTTRMIKAIIALDFYQAFRYNPFMFILSIFCFIYILYMVIIYIKKEEIKLPSFKIVIIIVISLFIYMLLRNLPGFEYLKPISIH